MSSPKRAKYSSKDETAGGNDYLKSLREIEDCQDQLEVFQDKTYQEILKLEQKLECEKRPVYVKRDEAISQIPNFWTTAFLNHPELSSLLNESEEEYLMYLDRLEVLTSEDVMAGFKITFHFKENPYFKNSSLTKEYNNTVTAGKTTHSITATPVLWKEGQDISTKLKESKSFLYWLISQDYGPNDIDLAQAIKDELWTNPLHYYLLSDTEHEENSDDEDENDDVLIIEDSDDQSNQEEQEEEESDNESEEFESPSSSEGTQNENEN